MNSSISDLVVAAVELAGLMVLRLDMGFVLIAEIPGQPVKRRNIGWSGAVGAGDKGSRAGQGMG